MNDIILFRVTKENVRIRANSVHGMLWLQTHFSNDDWDELSQGVADLEFSTTQHTCLKMPIKQACVSTIRHQKLFQSNCHLRPIGRYDFRCARRWACCLYIKQMQISHEQLDELTGVIEDTVEYFCDQQLVSGELVWSVLECLAVAKQAEIKGELAPTVKGV